MPFANAQDKPALPAPPPPRFSQVQILLDLKVFVFIYIRKCGFHGVYGRVCHLDTHESKMMARRKSVGKVEFKPAPS
jgi:hypothetical protein